MNWRVCLCVVALAACSTEPDQNVTGSWQGTFAISGGSGGEWLATLTQTGTSLSGSVNCASIESYTVSGTNTHNTLQFTLLGGLGDTAFFSGTASNNQGVQASGTFFDHDGAACFSGAGTWQGRIQ
ncbi:MAG TPA: hypothetical protein VH163_09565 [Gemmatimonadales bacterium]|jgi:hypothetical protein|nr:hypothetical protein [Gemmatimonadales bacterium]